MRRLIVLLLICVVCWWTPPYCYGQEQIAYSCWFDEDYSTLQTGTLTNNEIILDISLLGVGFHSVNVQFGSDSNAQITRHIFYRTPTESTPFYATSYSCWFDEDYSTLQTCNIGNGIINLDVSNLSDGFHSVNVQYGTGDHAQLSRHFFYKVPTEVLHSGPIIYSCWFDQVDSVNQSGTLPEDGIIMLDASYLSDSNHTVFVQFGNSDNAQLSSHIFWKKAIYYIGIEDTAHHGTISVTSTTDTIIDGHFLFDSATVTITVTPHELYVVDYVIVNGDTVTLPYTMTVTSDVNVVVSWKQAYHRLHYDDSPNGNLTFVVDTGEVVDGIYVLDGTSLTITASPNEQCELEYLVVNGDTVVSPYTLIVMEDVTIEAYYKKLLPDLHVTQVINSTPVAGQNMQVTYTVSNHGDAPTPIGAIWYDTIYLVQNADLRLFDPDDQNGFLLSVSNLQGLDTGESYTNTVTVTIPPEMVGTYYLFVLTDQPDATAIDFSENNNLVPDPYTPSLNGIPYHYMTAYVHRAGYGAVEEIVDNDNFFFKRINIATPPSPDLVVTNITAPTNFYSGTEINVVATIANQGQSATKSYGWLDALYYSHTDHYDSTAILLKTVYHDALENSALPIGDTYQTIFNCSLPAPWHGATYMYVVTDASNSEYEYAGENNNIKRSAMANVIMTPPADLVVGSVAIPNGISNRDSFAVAYSIMNAGLGKTNNNEWYDHIYLSTSPDMPVLQLNADGNSTSYSYHNIPDSTDWCVFLGSNRQLHSEGLMAGASVSTEKKYELPYFIDKTRQMYIIVIADVNNNVFEFNREDNNIGHSSAVNATIFYPDFALSDIQAPDTMVSGHIIDLGIELHNEGLINYFNNLDFKIYYSTDSVFEPSTATLLFSRDNYTSSMTDYPNSLSLPVQFPGEIVDSNYYLYFIVNKDSIVPEYSLQNNMLRGGPYYICHRTLPDLVLCNVVISDTLRAGELATVMFDIVNDGESVDGRVANIYSTPFHTALMANDSIWCPVQMQVSPFEMGMLTLAVGDTMHYCQTVKVPPMVSDSVSFTLKIDAKNRIQELDEENNQTTISRYVLPTRFDLAARNINMPSVYSTGDTIQITWTTSIANSNSFCYDTVFGSIDVTGYTNIKRWGDNSNGNLWINSLYLSSDSILSSDDLPITQNIVQTIPSDSIMHRRIRAIMPHSVSGSLYIIAKADVRERCFEATKDNNTISVPVTANLSAQPNLTVTALTIDDTVTQNQGCKIYYTVTNIGEGVIARSYWTDALYIGSTRIALKPNFRSLSVGESYIDSLEVVMPADSLGTIALILIADEGNRIFENQLEEDNYMVRPVVIIPAPPCDLVVSSVTADAAVIMGDSLTVTWVTQNIGANSIKGQIKDAVYLSTNQTYDDGDIMIGTVSYSDNLPVGASRQHSLSTVIQSDLSEGNYYVIVRTNIMRAFNEVSFANNSTSSISPTTVTMPLLYVGQEEQFTLASGNKAYYKMEVGPELAGKTLAVTLKSKVISEINIRQSKGILLSSDIGQTEPVFMTIRGKSIWIGHRTLVGIAMSSDGGGSLNYDYEPTTEEMFVLVDHYLYKIMVSNSVYSWVVGNMIALNNTISILDGLYISHEAIPTLSVCDFSVSRPDDTTQVLMIPSLKEGTYYFMTTAQSSGRELHGAMCPSFYHSNTQGSMNSNNINNESVHVLQEDDYINYSYYILPWTEVTNQSMRLKADIVDFEILDVNTAIGSNTGSTTTHITGALFDTVMDFRLTSPEGIIPASNVQIVNPTEAYVTFNLTDVSEGTYNVEAELPGGIITSKNGTFYVGQNLPSELSVNIVAPAKVRVGQVTGINIEYNNSGASDLNVVGLLVRPSAGTYISPTANPDEWVNGDIFIRFPEMGSPIYGGLMIPWSNQNQAPAIRDVVIPPASSTPQSPSSGSMMIPAGRPTLVTPGRGGSYEFYTRPGSAGRGTLDVYPVYRAIAR